MIPEYIITNKGWRWHYKVSMRSVSQTGTAFYNKSFFSVSAIPRKAKKEMYQDVPLEGVWYYPIENESNSETTAQHTAASCGMHISCREEMCA